MVWGSDLTSHSPHAGGKWTRPEQLQERRPVFIVNSTRAGSDLLGSASAALSATAMAFRSADAKYSLKAANHAVQLYK
jgi:endoglucanase